MKLYLKQFIKDFQEQNLEKQVVKNDYKWIIKAFHRELLWA